MKRVLLSLAYLCLLAGHAHARPPVLDDFLHLSEIGATTPSPDERWLAVEVRRPRLAPGRLAAGDEYLFERTDLWLVEIATRRARRLTNGDADGSWHWGPVWSPDSRKLAFLVYVPGKAVNWAIWHRDADSVQHIQSERSVDVGVNFGSSGVIRPHSRIAAAWVGPDRLLTTLLPEGSREAPFGAGVDTQTSEPSRQMTRLWEPTERGEASVTVWDSASLEVCGSDDELVRIDIATGAIEPLLRGAIRAVSVSPQGAYAAAVLARRPRLYGENEPVQLPLAWNVYNADAHVETELRIVDLQSGSSRALDSVADVGFLAARRLPRWAADESRLAVPARSLSGQDRLYELVLPGMSVAEVRAASPLDAELLAELSAVGGPVADRDERAFFSHAQPRRGRIPGHVVRFGKGSIGVFVDGGLSLFDGDGRIVRRISDVTPLDLRSHERHPEHASFIAQTSAGLERITVHAESSVAISSPEPAAELVASLPGRGEYVFVADTDQGSTLWLTGASGKAARVLELNRHLREVTRPVRTIVRYRSRAGDERQALMLTPATFRKGSPQPMVVEGYPATVIGGEHDHAGGLNRFYHHRRHLLVANGYLVLIPSIQWPQNGTVSPLELMVDGVLDAIEAAIGQGYADADRIGFVGHSYGGYMGLALATRTTRFKAIVAMAGYSDLAAYHDTVAPRKRTSACGPSLQAMRSGEMEELEGIMRMGAPPLASLERYIDNSPYFWLRNVRTPILFMHGDQDGVNDSMSERAFIALLRLGVPVQFARYWGEAHTLRSAGNIRDANARTLAWFDLHVRSARTASAVGSPRQPPSAGSSPNSSPRLPPPDTR